jgi:hypothetical protein
MIEQNVQKYEIDDRVYMNGTLYKIVYIYDDGSLKLKSVKGKTNETIFRVPIKFVTRE